RALKVIKSARDLKEEDLKEEDLKEEDLGQDLDHVADVVRPRRKGGGKYGQNVNPFFNFLKTLRDKYKGCPANAIAKKGRRVMEIHEL
ncbi:hypothetical protein L9F63_017668, partial [Diploptera punctata]